MHKVLTDQLKRTFRPEFLNRVDSIIVFRQLNQEDIRKIVDIIIDEVNERLIEHELTLSVSDAAKDWLTEHGYDREFGARPLRRLIQSSVEDKLSDAVLAGKFGHGDHILIDAKDDQIALELLEKQPSTENGSGEQVEEEALPTAS
jgi:ATP-dependent Clp protease ATP-binding subunit ClpC